MIICDILSNISRSEDTQKMKFGQLMEHNRNIFLQNHAKSEAERLVPGLFFFFLKKALNEVKASGLQLSFNVFR